jgi:hypothetical protein
MFGTLKSLAKAAVGVVTLPVDVAADFITMGGALTDRDKLYTAKKAGQIMDNLSDAADPDKD